jgi:hypothetical protein
MGQPLGDLRSYPRRGRETRAELREICFGRWVRVLTSHTSDVYFLGVGRLEVRFVPAEHETFHRGGPGFRERARESRRNTVVPLMLAEKGKRANVQNEIVDEEHDAAASICGWGARSKAQERK